MARKLTPKNKLARRIGSDLGLTTSSAKLARRLNIPPGQHGRRGRRKISDYGQQLLEKQKVKWMYGILERQFRRYFQQASKVKKATGKTLLQLLERRLDNVIFRLGLAPTRKAARQLVTHGHARVNNKKVSIPSCLIKKGDIITLSPKALDFPQTLELLKEKDKNIPGWIQRKAAVGKIVRLPQREDIDADIDEQLIVEFYSR